MKSEETLSELSLVQAWARVLVADSETSTMTLVQLLELPSNQVRIFWFLAVPSAIAILAIALSVLFWWWRNKK